MTSWTRRGFLGLIAWAMLVTPGVAGPLDDLERARAAVISGWLVATPGGEGDRLRLGFLERRFLDHAAVLGRSTPNIRRAFANLELTLLAETASRHDRPLMEVWLTAVGLATADILAAEIETSAAPN